MRQYYCGLENYSEETLEILMKDSALRGIALGDCFCQKRMFPGGVAQEIVCLQRVLESGKEILYQTPLYVTERNWDETLSIVELLSGGSVRVVTTDMGVASAIHRAYPAIPLIFGMLGRDRTHAYSSDWVAALRDVGFSGMETDSPVVIRQLTRGGVEPYIVYGFLCYRTLGRICYLQYQTGHCDKSACLNGSWELRSEEGDYALTMNGYMMGARYRYRDKTLLEPFLLESSAPLTIRAKSLADFRERVSEWNAPPQ